VGYDSRVRAPADATPDEYQDELGNDLTLVDYFLSLTPAERLDAWQSYSNEIAVLQQNARVLAKKAARSAQPTPG
jgi:hypothetical protein